MSLGINVECLDVTPFPSCHSKLGSIPNSPQLFSTQPPKACYEDVSKSRVLTGSSTLSNIFAEVTE